MCRVCEKPCWRDGGEAECEVSDREFEAGLEQLEQSSGVIDLMERLAESLYRSKRREAQREGDDSE
jgi:hypothetical protein